jgi:hypothetical protein
MRCNIYLSLFFVVLISTGDVAGNGWKRAVGSLLRNVLSFTGSGNAALIADH